jgi:hypothetical protein
MDIQAYITDVTLDYNLDLLLGTLTYLANMTYILNMVNLLIILVTISKIPTYSGGH